MFPFILPRKRVGLQDRLSRLSLSVSEGADVGVAGEAANQTGKLQKGHLHACLNDRQVRSLSEGVQVAGRLREAGEEHALGLREGVQQGIGIGGGCGLKGGGCPGRRGGSRWGVVERQGVLDDVFAQAGDSLA